MFMSYPSANHLQYRLKAEGNGILLTLIHQSMGLIQPEHHAGVSEGWKHGLARIRESAERKVTSHSKAPKEGN
jgi:hypothetical protein